MSQVTIFSEQGFEAAQRMARALTASNLVPAAYAGGSPQAIANTLLALEISQQMRLSPLQVMQNLHIVEGKPCFKSTFQLALISRFGLRVSYEIKHHGEKTTVYKTKTFETKVVHPALECVATFTKDGEVIGTGRFTTEMAVLFGWWTRGGSQWPVDPEHMLKLRTVSRWISTNMPEVLLFPTEEEVRDFPEPDVDLGLIDDDLSTGGNQPANEDDLI